MTHSACTPIELPGPADDASPLDTSPAESARPGTQVVPEFAQPLGLGEQVPDFGVITQEGESVQFTGLTGSVVILSFFSCRHPDGSPGRILARRLRELQDTLRPDLWDRVQIFTVSVEPTNNTAGELRRCGESLGADFDRWTFAAPSAADFTGTAAKLGVVIWHEEQETAHTLSTLVIDQQGAVADRFPGITQWSVDDLIAVVVHTAEH